MEKTVHRFKLLGEIVVNILFPKKVAVRLLEKMSAGEILARVARAEPIQGAEYAALFSYSDPLVKKIVWEIKYRGNTALASTVGRPLCEKILYVATKHALFERHESVLIIPIPISTRRRKHRGFSQTELITEAIMKHIPEDLRASFIYCPSVLMKIKETPAQATLGSRNARLSNLSGSFGFANDKASDLIRGKNIILIDDVITTGATMHEVSGVLLDAGAKSVVGFGIAH